MHPETDRLTRVWPRWIHAFAWGTLFLLFVLLLCIIRGLQDSKIWQSWSDSSELRRSAYAEQIYPDRIFRTRANTWSNLAYVLVGLYGIALGWHDRRNVKAPTDGYLVKTPAMSFLFGIACCQLGFGSGLFHASLTRLGQQIDVASMYSPLLTMLAVSLGRWAQASGLARFQGLPTTAFLVTLVTICSGLLFAYKWSMSSLIVLSSLIAAVGISIIIDQLRTAARLELKWLCWSFILLVAGVACRELDIAGRFSQPTSWFQGHAVWHLLTSLSLASLYCYHRSERVYAVSVEKA